MATEIKEWLADYKDLSNEEKFTYASTIRNNSDVIKALYALFENDGTQEIIDPVCDQLFDFYRSDYVDLKRFTLEFVPALIGLYLRSLTSFNNVKRNSGVKSCLLGIYNLDILNKDGSDKKVEITIPNLGASIYHEPPNMASMPLRESELNRYWKKEKVTISKGPFPHAKNFNSQNRFSILSRIISIYNDNEASMSFLSRKSLCTTLSRLVTSGFDNLKCDEFSFAPIIEASNENIRKSSVRFEHTPRISLNSRFLVDALDGVYFAMFNGNPQVGADCVRNIHARACYEIYPDVLLMTNAILNSLSCNPSGQPGDGPIGININPVVSPTISDPNLTKSLITNASFKTHKLTEDIEVSSDEVNDEDPPKYDEIIEQDRKNSLAEQLKEKSKPLKSIMKKANKKCKEEHESPKRPNTLEALNGAVYHEDSAHDSSVDVDDIEFISGPNYAFSESNKDTPEKPLLTSFKPNELNEGGLVCSTPL